MSFPYINAYQQFFDSSGDPLVSGTIEFRDPTSNALINTYPTADDADAQTNANANPLTLSATGAASAGLFLEDGVAYKVILKDAAGNTVATHDDVLCPTNIPALSVRSFGATGDGVTDDTAAIQAALDAGKKVTGVTGDIYSVTNLTVSSVAHVELDGQGSTILATSGTVLKTVDCNKVILRNICFDGNNADVNRFLDVTYTATAGAVATGMDQLLVEGCTFKDVSSSTYHYAMQIPWISCRNLVIRDNIFSNLYATPNSTVGDVNGSVRGIRCSSEGATPTPSEADCNPTSGRIYNNRFVNFSSTEDSEGIHCLASATNNLMSLIEVPIVIAGNYFEDIGSSAIKLQMRGLIVRDNTVVLNDQVSDMRAGGIRSISGSISAGKNLILNNYVEIAATTSAGIQIDDDSVAKGNQITGVGSGVFYGLDVQDGSNTQMLDNKIRGVVTRGIEVRASAGVTITNTRIINNDIESSNATDAIRIWQEDDGLFDQILLKDNRVVLTASNSACVVVTPNADANEYQNITNISIHGGYYSCGAGTGHNLQLSGKDIDIKNVVLEGASTRGAVLLGSTATAAGADNVRMEQCIFRPSTSPTEVIRAYTVNNVLVINNEIPSTITALFNSIGGYTQTGHKGKQNTLPDGSRFIFTLPNEQTPAVNQGEVYLTNATTQTYLRLDDGIAGDEITIISKGAITFDTSPATLLIGSSADIVTASGDVTMWVCETGGVTDAVWRLKGFVDVSADNSAGA